MSELIDQIALVTGGTRGIGRAISQELAEAGSRVAIVDILEEAKSVAAELPGTGHGGFICDVSNPAECSELIGRVEETLGPVTILVNNAGITRDNILVRLKDRDWDSVIDTNLSGPFYLVRAVARGMMKRRSGKIVNVSSVVGLTGNRGQSNYAAAKAGLIALTKSVAQELAARPGLLLVAGRYEGIDERVVQGEVAEELSLGDFVLSGGELAAAVVIDAVARLIPGVLNHEASGQEDSHMSGLLGHPQYTRPDEADGMVVPEVLVEGHHEAIRCWRLKQALGRTWLRRPELLESRVMSVEEEALLQEFIKEHTP